MPTARVNGTRLYYERNGGAGIPLVFVHGGWLSHASWSRVAPPLAESFCVVTYDRRGHSQSAEAAPTDGILEDVADLAALLEHLELAPAWVIGVSSGGSVALRLAAERPDLLQGLIAHEPAVFSLLGQDAETRSKLEAARLRMDAVVDRIRSGDHAGAAEEFVETVALGPGTWDRLSPEYRRTFVENASTFLNDMSDPHALDFELDWIDGYQKPALFTLGGQSPPIYAPAVDRLVDVMPHSRVLTFQEAGHVPHRSHPEDYVRVVTDFVSETSTVDR